MYRPMIEILFQIGPTYYVCVCVCSCAFSMLVLSYVYSKLPIFGLTQELFRELSFSRLECGGVHDRLHICPLCWDIFFPWHRHRIEGTDGFKCLLRNTRDTQSLMLRARFLHLLTCPVPGHPGIEPATSGMLSGRANHYTTAPPLYHFGSQTPFA